MNADKKIDAERLRAIADRVYDPPATLDETTAMALECLAARETASQKPAKRKKVSKPVDPAKPLRDALTLARSISANHYLPILLHAVLDRTTLRATDLYQEIEITIPDVGAGPGLVLIQEVLDAVKAGGEVSWDGARMLSAGSTVATLSTGVPPVEEYPPAIRVDTPPETGENGTPWMQRECIEHTCDAGELRYVMRSVDHAMGEDSTRPHLFGTLLVFPDDGGPVVATTTDGHRLATSNVKGYEVGPELLLPTSASRLLVRMLKGVTGPVRVRGFRYERTYKLVDGTGTQKKGLADFTTADWTLRTVLPDEQFPPYNKVIPSLGIVRYTLDRETLLAKLRAVPGSYMWGLEIAADDETHELILRQRDPGAGEREDRMPAEHEGPDIRTAALTKYLREAVESIEARKIVIDFGRAGGKEPELDPLRVWSPERPGEMRVIMPMRL